MIRALAIAEAERRFAIATRELLGSGPSQEYWQAPSERGPVSGEKLEQFQRLRREKWAAIAALFGEEYANGLTMQTANTYAYANRRFASFDYLPPDKRLHLIEYLESSAVSDFASARLTARLGRDPLAEELKKEQEIRLLLGPVLYEEYVKRSSGAAQNLREELRAFAPSGAEFNAILQAEREFQLRAREAGAFPYNDPQNAGKVQAAQEQKREAIRSILGDSRFADYERATDWSFRHLDSLGKELGLDSSVARSAYARIERARSSVERLMQNRDPRDEQLQREIMALRGQLQTRLAEDFGLTDLNEHEAQSLLGPALNIWQGRAYGYSIRRGVLSAN